MLLPDCKCRSGFFEVIRLLTFSLPLLPPLFLPLFFLLFRLLLRCSRAAPVPGAQPGLGAMRKAAARLRCSGLVAVTCLLCRIRPGNPAGIVARKILRGCLSGVFCMGARDPCVVRLPGRAGLDVYRRRFRTETSFSSLFSDGRSSISTIFERDFTSSDSFLYP